MAVTSTQSKAPASVSNFAVGRYLDDGTAAAFTITTGFQPRYVKVVNVDEDTDGESLEWFEGMADASAILRVAAGTTTIITTLGITPTAKGFTVGIQTDVNVTNEQISWLAIG